MLHLGLEWSYLCFQFIVIPKMLLKINCTHWKIILLYSVNAVMWLCDTLVKCAVGLMGKTKGVFWQCPSCLNYQGRSNWRPTTICSSVVCCRGLQTTFSWTLKLRRGRQGQVTRGDSNLAILCEFNLIFILDLLKGKLNALRMVCDPVMYLSTTLLKLIWVLM